MSSYFITSTGTDIGKTIVTSTLITQLRLKGLLVNPVKPVISGYDEKSSLPNDLSILLGAAAQEYNQANIDNICTIKLKEPLSPHIAARNENKIINYNDLISFCQYKVKQKGITLIEGAGGVMVPINDEYLFIDLIRDLRIKVILVVGSYLGSISHSLTTIGMLEKYNIDIHAIIINESENSLSLPDMKKTLINFTDHKKIEIFRRIDIDVDRVHLRDFWDEISHDLADLSKLI